MITVWKFEVEPPEHGSVSYPEMPAGAELLSVATEAAHGEERIMLYARVDTEQPKTRRPVGVYATGDRCDPHDRFIGTALFSGTAFRGGRLVFHLFELVP